MRAIDGSFALVPRDVRTVRLARSPDRPRHYFLAKGEDVQALVVADSIDTLAAFLASEPGGSSELTRMMQAHHVVT